MVGVFEIAKPRSLITQNKSVLECPRRYCQQPRKTLPKRCFCIIRSQSSKVIIDSSSYYFFCHNTNNILTYDSIQAKYSAPYYRNELPPYSQRNTPHKVRHTLVYLDNIIVYSPLVEQHHKDLKAVLATLEQHKLLAKPSK
ncbi:hypothetical protein DSO57_1021007 [Entomophthora muscae]|uniref:Uncharacterized protein n=1 Tax=Entomophthora muscae TaxID=34485 RepID=A0ACC2RI77_9FUNG|nr:hypothetical protein DSO57_1021007 [Entomophthora muscae]